MSSCMAIIAYHSVHSPEIFDWVLFYFLFIYRYPVDTALCASRPTNQPRNRRQLQRKASMICNTCKQGEPPLDVVMSKQPRNHRTITQPINHLIVLVDPRALRSPILGISF